ncbi:hypothetical protein [Paenibacillus oleatilyticus]|uniref:hypothetical protein n=1 Tax=Paenibacillus oleatilyticus TaxID=2594886 RepID=UPI001C1F48A1|nr:hypothetical protein [Paenibacillus oleatilyticus]MBU7319748.1 hypothetical protein [Paenibacillus oleatilyticus]
MIKNEKIFPLIYRLLTRKIYKKKKNDVSAPSLVEVIAFIIFERAPLSYFNKFGHEGLIKIAFSLQRLVLLFYSFLKFFYRIAKLTLTMLKKIKRVFRKDRHSTTFTDGLPYSSNTIIMGDIIAFHGFRVESKKVFLYFSRFEEIKSDLLFFVHAYPENVSQLSQERLSQGYFSLDNWPAIPIRHWPGKKTYTNIIDFSSFASGYYKIKVGIYNPVTFERLSIQSTADNSIDLGWILIK